MSLVIGIQCRNGVVIGSDSTALLGDANRSTVKMDCSDKIRLVENLLVGAAGNSAMFDKFADALITMQRAPGRSILSPIDTQRDIEKTAGNDVSLMLSLLRKAGTPEHGLMAPLADLLIASQTSAGPRLYQYLSKDLTATMASEERCYLTIGAANVAADPFLWYLHATVWKKQMPDLSTAVFSIFLTLKYIIQSNASGVGGRPVIGVLDGKKVSSPANILQDADLEEHDGAFRDFESMLVGLRDSYQTPPQTTLPPPDPPAEEVLKTLQPEGS